METTITESKKATPLSSRKMPASRDSRPLCMIHTPLISISRRESAVSNLQLSITIYTARAFDSAFPATLPVLFDYLAPITGRLTTMDSKSSRSDLSFSTSLMMGERYS
jgi:hypothetical protein